VINGEKSYWKTNAGTSSIEFPRLAENLDVDVAIVGGGLTGLWTAWALLRNDPGLDIAVFEAEDLGFGASGRNGGWLSAKPVGMRSVLARERSGRGGVHAVDRILASSIDEIVDILGADQIDAKRGGYMDIARSKSELARVERHIEDARSWGLGPDRMRLLSAEEVHERVRVNGAVGGMYSPDNYRVDPYKLVLAVAKLAQSSGAAIYTSSRVDDISDGRLRVAGFTVRAKKQVVVATEGYSKWEAGQKRSLLPMNSTLMVTEPLTDEQWRQVGWECAEGIRGVAHSFYYGIRTPDDRIAIGGRGNPYRFASGLDHDGRVDDQKTVTALVNVLRDLFPQVSLQPAHVWCGVLGVSRDWSPFIDAETVKGVTRVGGYAGQGLTGSYVAGRIVADLVHGKPTELTDLPWVRPMPRRWEPEPLRWLGANGIYKAYEWADHLESRRDSDRTAWPARLADLIAGR